MVINMSDYDMFSYKPDHVCEEGTKWWKFDIYNNVPTYFTESVDGSRSYVAIFNKKIIAEDSGLQGVSAKVDLWFLLNRENVAPID